MYVICQMGGPFIIKNCDRSLENVAKSQRSRAAFSSPSSQFFAAQTDPKLVNNLFIFPSASLRSLYYCWTFTSTHRKRVTGTVVRKNRTALRTNKIAGFFSLPFWHEIKKNKRIRHQYLNRLISGYFSLPATCALIHVSASFLPKTFMSTVYELLETILTLPWVPAWRKKAQNFFFSAENAIKHLRFNFSFALVLKGM